MINKKLLITCDNCNKELYRFKSLIRPKHNYCSYKCKSEWQKKHLLQETNPNWKGGLIIQNCKLCMKEFSVKRYLKNKQQFCSWECHAKSMFKRIKLICPICNKEFETIPYNINKYNRRYCSQKCHSIQKARDAVITKRCIICNKEFESMKGRRRKICDDVECRSKFYSGSRNFRWLGGKSYIKGIKMSEWKQLSCAIMKRDNWLCQSCRKSNDLLHVHHIVPYRFSKDNSPDNLITLCPNCHSKADIHYLRYKLPIKIENVTK